MKLEINLYPEKAKIITFYHDRSVNPIIFYSELDEEAEDKLSQFEAVFNMLPFEDPTGTIELEDESLGITYFIEKVVGGYSIGLSLENSRRVRKRRTRI